MRGDASPSVNPANTSHVVGQCQLTQPEQVDQAIDLAAAAQSGWDQTSAEERAAIIERAADLFEENSAELLALCVAEAGKTVPDAISELREAVDFLRYYSQQAKGSFAAPLRPEPGRHLRSA